LSLGLSLEIQGLGFGLQFLCLSLKKLSLESKTVTHCITQVELVNDSVSLCDIFSQLLLQYIYANESLRCLDTAGWILHIASNFQKFTSCETA